MVYNNFCVARRGNTGIPCLTPGCGSAWLERLVWDQEVAGSNPVTPIITYARVAQLVEHDLAKVGVAGSSPVSRSFYL